MKVVVRKRSFMWLRKAANLLSFVDSGAGTLFSTNPYVIIAGSGLKRMRIECLDEDHAQRVVAKLRSNPDLTRSELRSMRASLQSGTSND